MRRSGIHHLEKTWSGPSPTGAQNRPGARSPPLTTHPIHPTGVATREGIGDEAFRVYELVLRRFLATLAPDALWQTMKVYFDAGGEAYTATGGRLVEPGWHTVYPFSEAKETILPAFVLGEKLPIRTVSLDQKETMPPARYTQSKLIQRMEELGLGTKSTRHEVIAKLCFPQVRGRKPAAPDPCGPCRDRGA